MEAAAAASSALVFPSEIERGPIRTIRGFVKLRLDSLKREKLRPGLCLATANVGFRKALNGVADGDGVIIVDHGSRRDESNLMLRNVFKFFSASHSSHCPHEYYTPTYEENLPLVIMRSRLDIFKPNYTNRSKRKKNLLKFLKICKKRTRSQRRTSPTLVCSPSLKKRRMMQTMWWQELAEPSIKDAFDLCVQQGAKRVIVSPFFLSPGRHWNKDIPSLTAEAAKEHPGVSYIVTAPLGLHELLVNVVNDRINHCLSHVAGVAEECRLCAGTGKCRLYFSIASGLES